MKSFDKSRAKSPLLGLAALVLVTGCVNFGGSAAPSALLTLSAANYAEVGAVQTGAARDALIVLMPEVPRKLDTNRVPVQVNASSIAYIKDAIWSDKPARLMQYLLMETVTAKNGRLVLNEVDAGGKAEEFLSGSLLEFGVDAGKSEAVVVYDAVKLVRGKVIEKRRFEAREPVYAIEAVPVGEAMNAAANTVAAQIAVWLSSK